MIGAPSPSSRRRTGWRARRAPPSPTTLNAGALYIFTSFVTNAFTQPVNSAVVYATSDYTGGAYTGARVTSGDLKDWSLWSTGSSADILRDVFARIGERLASRTPREIRQRLLAFLGNDGGVVHGLYLNVMPA